MGFPVSLGDVIQWDADYDGSLVRTSIFPLDVDQEPLTTEGGGGVFISQASATINATYGRYSQGANISATSIKGAPACVVRSEVKYVRVGFYLGTAGLIRHFSASLYTQQLSRGLSEGDGTNRNPMKVINGVPTKGYVPQNTAIWDYTGAAMKRVSFQYETRVSGALAAGATSVTVAAISTVANGDVVGILLDNYTTHWTAVSALAGSAFTIAAIPVGRSVPDGARIVFNRWA